MDNGESSYRRFLKGDKEALGDIADLYRENLIFFLYRYVKSVETAEDLAEDVFVELILHPGRYDFRVQLKTYLFTIGRNKAVDYLRKHARLSLCSMETAEELADMETLEENVLKSEENKRLNEALAAINEDYRYALHLVYFEELSYEEAGRIMKKSRKQIENLVYRGKHALRGILAKEAVDFEKQG